MNNSIKEEVIREGNSMKDIFKRFKKKDFSGSTGQAIKNSSYQLTQNLVMKIGALIFTIILARILAPDRMGLYSLAFSTIVFLAAFSDLGIGSALMTFVSRCLGKNDLEKAKGYVKVLFKWKSKLLLISMGILIVSAYFIANYYYNKPIFFALLSGALYIPTVGVLGFIEILFKTSNDFKRPLIKDIVFQILRLLIVPGIVFVLIKFGMSNQRIVFGAIMGLTFAYFVSLLYLILKAKKKIGFLHVKATKLTKNEQKNLITFILPLSTMALSGMFFGYIDTLMLGHYVAEKFIAYYGAALALVGSVGGIIGFIVGGVMPILARKEGHELENLFRKSRNFNFIISILAGVTTYFLADIVVKFAYGIDYSPAGNILKFFSALIVIGAISGIYDGYFIIRGKTKIIMWLLIISTIINIVLNISFITWGIAHYGAIGGLYGAVTATILSRVLYLIGIIGLRNK